MPQRTLGQMITLYAKEAKYEILKYVRIPIFTLSTILFPVMFYVLFGIVMAPAGARRTETATYLLATMACYGVMGVAMFSFGVGIAMERGQGWLQVKRASPMPLPAYFLAKIANAVVFATVISLVLLAVGSAFGGVRSGFVKAAELIAILVAGSIPFSAMGLALGYFAKPNSAPAMVNLVYLPMSFCSGLWIPIFLLPHVLAKGGADTAAVSHEPVGAERYRRQSASVTGVGTRRGADRSDVPVPRHRRLWVLA